MIAAAAVVPAEQQQVTVRKAFTAGLPPAARGLLELLSTDQAHGEAPPSSSLLWVEERGFVVLVG